MLRRIAAVTLAALPVLAAPARAALDPCTDAIGKAVVGYVKAKQKIVFKCEDARASGGLTPSVNCRPAEGPVTDAKTNDQLGKAAAKVKKIIDAKCTGTLPPLGPVCNSATTPALLEGCITAPTQDPDIDSRNVDVLIGAVYGPSAPADPSLVACRQAISKGVGKYLNARMKTKQKCLVASAKGKTGACPDAAAGAKLDKARVKFDAAIRKTCTESEVAADSPPSLEFGFPCEAYKVITFRRNPADPTCADPDTCDGLPVLDRLIPCLADATAGAADFMTIIGLPAPETSGFAQGVAAGDATESTAIFWTRVPNPLMSASLDISTDPAFGSGVQTLTGLTPDADGVIKEDVGSLLAKTTYYYRFHQGSDTSAVGRVTTTPLPTDSTRVIHMGWTGDSNAYYQPFTSLDPIRLLQPDAWFYIGDTIYGDDPKAEDGLNAMTQPEYEEKYRLNRADAGLRHLMESTGTYTMWDDHEVRNDFSGAVPVFATRMAAGNAAYRRYMPLRENGTDPMQLYRNFQWGTAAEFFLVDYRQYRSAKYTCCSQGTSGFVTTDADSTCTGGGAGEATFPTNGVNGCDTGVGGLSGPSRTILGTNQKAWLKSGLLNSTATFKFIMNGPPITQLAFLPYDRWEAYPVERQEVLDYIEANNIKNVIWLSTDFHCILISPNRVDNATDTHHTPELVDGAIGENTLFRELPAGIVPLLKTTVPGLIQQVSEFDLDRYNAIFMTVDPTAVPPTAKFDFYDRTGAVIHTITFTATP